MPIPAGPTSTSGTTGSGTGSGTASPVVTRQLLANLGVGLGSFSFGAASNLCVNRIVGIDDLPEIRLSDSPKAQTDGIDFGIDYYNGRVIEIDASGRPVDYLTVLAELRQALATRDTSMVISGIPGYPDMVVRGRVRKRKILDDVGLHHGIIQVFFDFETDDPRMYSAIETTSTAGPGTATGTGLIPPLTPPLTSGGSAVGGYVVATNEGNATTYPKITVHGPVNGFTLQNSTTGKSLRFTQALGSSDYLVFDMLNKTVLLGGTASRRAYMFGSWLGLEPGDNVVYYLPNDTAVGSSMTVVHQSAWM